jgi:hypothetical protein
MIQEEEGQGEKVRQKKMREERRSRSTRRKQGKMK